MTENRFEKLSTNYETEQRELEITIKVIEEELNAKEERKANVDKFVKLVERYTDFEELTTPMINEFVEKVVVHQIEKAVILNLKILKYTLILLESLLFQMLTKVIQHQ